VTSVPKGAAHPESLDTILIDAISNKALSEELQQNAKARQATVTFLYLYMIMADASARLVEYCVTGSQPN
jgi:hypothetical protein